MCGTETEENNRSLLSKCEQDYVFQSSEENDGFTGQCKRKKLVSVQNTFRWK